jgi:hypothetical protein
MSLQNYHSSLCNTPEERTSHLRRDGSLKSGKLCVSYQGVYWTVFTSCKTDVCEQFSIIHEKELYDIHRIECVVLMGRTQKVTMGWECS